MSAKDPENGRGIADADVRANIVTFINAGHETTANALPWTLFLLSQCPEWRGRAEADADKAFDYQGTVATEKCEILRAVFEEALRLYPPAPSINRAAISNDSWTSPKGERVEIEAGVTVLIMPWTLHRHELHWDRPRAYMPERFLPENRGSIGRFQFLPFGAGPRVCIGATFALQEAVIALAVLMHRYRFDSTDQTNPWPVQKLTTQPQNGLPMRVTPRIISTKA